MERLTLRDDDGRPLLTPYGLRIYCSTQATADCICKLEEALQAQEPRVLTADEMNQWNMDAWIEDRDEDRVVALDESVAGFAIACMRGKKRVWTSRPTDAQRKAVKWE